MFSIMQHNNTYNKILISLFLFGVIIWLGGSIIRMAIAYDIYVPGTELQLKTQFTNSERLQTVRLFSMGALYTDISFGVIIITSVLLIIRLRKNLKENGWLFMGFILIFLSVPFELFLIYLDIKLNLAFNASILVHYEDQLIQECFVIRFRKLAVVSPLTYLAVATSLLFVIWQPLAKKKNPENHNITLGIE